jgi:RHS repeat-associated protein
VNSTNYNAANQQLTFGDKTLTYDNNGNLMSITDANGTTLYSWNARNQLAAISGPNVNASFLYDGLGRREKKTIGGSLTEFLYDGVNPVQETSGATVLANILSGLGIDEYVARTDVSAGTTNSYLPDALGSALALADSAGAVQTEYTYEPFGRTTANGASNSNPFEYTGRESDGTGLYYYRARYYHPGLQRFISEDPIGLGGGDVNLFSYVSNSPINFIDPLGLQVAIPAPIGPLPFPGIGRLPQPLSPSQTRDMMDFFRDLFNYQSRANNDPYSFPKVVDPGRDCNGKCNPCPPNGSVWTHVHKDGTISTHQIIWNQDPRTCLCYSDRTHL